MRTKKEEKGRRKGEFEAVLAQGRLPQPLLCQIQYFPCVGLKHTQAISPRTGSMLGIPNNTKIPIPIDQPTPQGTPQYYTLR